MRRLLPLLMLLLPAVALAQGGLSYTVTYYLKGYAYHGNSNRGVKVGTRDSIVVLNPGSQVYASAQQADTSIVDSISSAGTVGGVWQSPLIPIFGARAVLFMF